MNLLERNKINSYDTFFFKNELNPPLQTVKDAFSLIPILFHSEQFFLKKRGCVFVRIPSFYFPLCRFARFLRISAFILAAPDPCRPVI